MNGTLCIGIALQQDNYLVAACDEGHDLAPMSFPANAAGTAALTTFLKSWHKPIRLAVLSVGTAAISVAVALSAVPGSEVFLVSSATASLPAALVQYAERVAI
jgi:hypothetical protein